MPSAWLSLIRSRILTIMNTLNGIGHTKRLCPPEGVRGMTKLDRDAFKIEAQLPTVYIPANPRVTDIVSKLKRHDLLLKFRVKTAMKRRMPGGEEDASEALVPVVLNPEKASDWNSLPFEVQDVLCNFGVCPSAHFRRVLTTIDYSIWTKEDIFKSVLPEDVDGVSGYSIVGHIIHLNLKENLLPFKTLIGQVLLDKIPQAKSVINKVRTIDSKYRNFNLDLLAGEPNFKTRVRENNCLFELDFSAVYWNPRLSTEHKRILEIIGPNDTVVDGCAGIGPFVVPIAKKLSQKDDAQSADINSDGLTRKQRRRRVQQASAQRSDTPQALRVVANDLNPEACEWLRHNLKLNKIPEGVAQVHNLDAAELFQQIVRPMLCDFVSSISTRNDNARFHIILNLPALAVTFLPSLLGLLSDSESPQSFDQTLPVYVHCYTFARGEQPLEDAIRQVGEAMDLSNPPDFNLVKAHDVRNVAPMKQMVCVQIQLTQKMLFEVYQRPPSGSQHSSVE